MQQQIRMAVFETNSSSTHAISICRESADWDMTSALEKTLPSDGFLKSSGGDFGWGVESHSDFQTKLDYLVTHIYSGDAKDGLRKKEHWHDSVKNQRDMLDTVLSQNIDGCKGVKVIPTVGYYPLGYIDHQSAGTASHAFIDESALVGYLFSEKSVLYIDNDNH